MTKIGFISDTHGCWDDKFSKHLSCCDVILHAGDIGDMSVMQKLQEVAPVYAVHGNIDSGEVRRIYPTIQRIKIEGINIFMTHIGGYPTRYEPWVRKILTEAKAKGEPYQLFISGHSHILKVMPDPKLDLLHINPGAAGKIGWHSVRTLVRMDVEGNRMYNLEIIELN